MLSFFLPGRNRKLHHTLRLTALVLMIALICPGTGTAWAAPESGAGNMDGQAAIFIQKATEKMHVKFIQQYGSLWQSRGLDSQLRAAVAKSVDELYHGISGNWDALKDSGIPEVRRVIENKFSDPYEKFLVQLQDRIAGDYGKLLVEYFNERIAEIILHVDNPTRHDYIIRRSRELLANNNELLNKRILARLAANRRELYFEEIGLGIGIAIASSAFIPFLKNFIMSHFGISAGAMKAAGYFGLLMVGINLAEIAYDVWKAKDNLKINLEENYGTYYWKEAPENLWPAMEELVQDGFRQTENELQEIIREANELEESEEGKKLGEGFSNAKDRREYYHRVALLKRTLKVSPELINDFDKVLRSATNDEMKTLVSMLQIDSAQTSRWFGKFDYKVLFDLFGKLPEGIWQKYTPNDESLDTLQWIVNLNPLSREMAAELDPALINWARTGIPDEYINLLFSNPHSGSEIETEIKSLSKIPIKAFREPWMRESWIGEIKYQCFCYLPYIIGVPVVLLLLWIGFHFLSLFSGLLRAPKADGPWWKYILRLILNFLPLIITLFVLYKLHFLSLIWRLIHIF